MLKCAAIRSEILAASKIPTQNKYCRPRSHRVEVAAVGDPRTNVPPWSLADETDEAGGSTRASGDSTLKSTIRDAFPLRELRASQQTGDV
ncbi:hypothetical protein V1477_000631 [Vespula maculifrons]|uniref:Uncharacterized protein n=1 Tax=Vespula maculifrons TaxID=7453 RepID=A0ABD2D3Y7_VESMC